VAGGRMSPTLRRVLCVQLFMAGIGIALLSPACATKDVLTIERPNARTKLEEKAFNTLLVSETIITTAKASNDAGTLPEYMKPIINRLIDVHNSAKQAADVYVASLDAGDGEALSNLILSLDSIITSLFTGGTL